MINYIKTHKFETLLFSILLYILIRPFLDTIIGYRAVTNYQEMGVTGVYDSANIVGTSPKVASQPWQENVPGGSRKVVTETNISVQVDDVTKSIKDIESKVAENKGYVVSTTISRPEIGERGTINVRIPSDKVGEFVDFLRNSSVKVVSEYVKGYDVTDQYTDIEEQIRIYTETKNTYMEILADAKNLKDINAIQNITQMIINTQSQIDNYKGQLSQIQKTTSTSLITVSLATDASSLPYSEPLSWRPSVIFKHAYRSLVATLQSVGTLVIWIAVYSVLIIPVILIAVFVLKFLRNRNRQL